MSKTRLDAYAEGAAMARAHASRQRGWAARLREWIREAEQDADRADQRATYYEQCAEREMNGPPPMTADEIIATLKQEGVA
jgi:hypothetical protein